MSEVLRDYRPEDVVAVGRLWERVFGTARGGQTPEWLFRPGPGGEAQRAVVELDGEIVAHAGATSLHFRLGDEIVRGGLSVGAMTDPRMRGRGFFVRAGRHLYARMEREGFAFVAGFSNRNSHGLMTGPLGRKSIRPFPWCLRPLFPLGQRSGGAAPADPVEVGPVRVAACEPADPRLDALWEAAAPAIRVGAVRDAAFGAWRFGTRPDAGYEIFLAEARGGPAAYGVLRMLQIRGLWAGFLADFLVAPDAQDAARALLRTLARRARRRGAVLLSALLPGAGPTHRALRRSGFVRIPEALHPQLIRYSVRGFGRYEAVVDLVDPPSWFLTWADTDVV